MFDKASTIVVFFLCGMGVVTFHHQVSQHVRPALNVHYRSLLADNSSSQNQASTRQDSTGRGLNPSVVIIVVILTVVFLLSGFLHLLARCCGRVAARREPTESAMSVLHGPLQHLFHLHDSGVDQAFIDTLPVFPYKAICGLKEGTDCAVCLSEFESEDRLRLLPKCKHAFHIECIDTWLLSHSTCPLCRCALLSDDVAPGNGGFSDSGRLGSTRSMRSDGYVGDSRRNSDMSRRMMASSSMLAEHGGESGSSDLDKGNDTPRSMLGMDSPEIQPVLDGTESEASLGSVLSVKLGRVERRSTNGSISGSSILRGRSYSMGSYEYVVDPANLQVIIAPTPYPGRGNSREFANGARPRHRSVFSDGIPELGSIPGTPADELFWATRGLATPEYGASRGMGTPECCTTRTPDFITSKEEGSGMTRLNFEHLAAEASLVPKHRDSDGAEVEGKGKEKSIEESNGKDWVSISLEEDGAESNACAQGTLSPLQEVVLNDKVTQESEESRILAGLERFFGSGWKSNVGLEKLAESMSRRDRGHTQEGCGGSRSKASEQGGESLKDHNNTSRRTFSFRFPVPDSLSKIGRSRRSLSEGLVSLSREPSVVACDSSSNYTTGYETAASKDGAAGFETASKESLPGLDSSSVGSFDSSWVAVPPPLPPLFTAQERGAHPDGNELSSSLARKTIHWLMGRDRRVVYAANFSPSPELGIYPRSDENLLT